MVLKSRCSSNCAIGMEKQRVIADLPQKRFDGTRGEFDKSIALEGDPGEWVRRAAMKQTANLIRDMHCVITTKNICELGRAYKPIFTTERFTFIAKLSGDR
jgi:hypothetical protein